jgi:beta-alanine--pyruvate transaminase
VFLDCFEQGVLIRTTGDTIALSPPLIISAEQIGQVVEAVAKAIRRVA